MHYEIAEMDHIKPPALLAYRDGDVFATIVDIAPQIPKGRPCTADTLEDLLKSYVSYLISSFCFWTSLTGCYRYRVL